MTSRSNPTLSPWTATAGRNAFRVWHGDGRTVPGNVSPPVRGVMIYTNGTQRWNIYLRTVDEMELGGEVFLGTKKDAMKRADEMARKRGWLP